MYCGGLTMNVGPVRFCMILRMRYKFLSIIGSGFAMAILLERGAADEELLSRNKCRGIMQR